VAIVGGALIAAAGATAGCARGVAIASAPEEGDAGGAAGEVSGDEQADAAADGGVGGNDAAGLDGARVDGPAVDARTEASSGDGGRDADEEAVWGEAPETGAEGGPDASPEGAGTDGAGPDGADPDAGAGLDADAEAGDDAAPDAEVDAGAEAGFDAELDAGCSDSPQVTFLAPIAGTTIHVRDRDSTTWVATFSVHVDFRCAPVQTVKFDYQGPDGTVHEQEALFTSYADPFTQQTQVGGPSPSLAAYDGGQSTSAWLFSVTAVDANNHSTSVSLPFTLLDTTH
jgi:hypothetical protein